MFTSPPSIFSQPPAPISSSFNFSFPPPLPVPAAEAKPVEEKKSLTKEQYQEILDNVQPVSSSLQGQVFYNDSTKSLITNESLLIFESQGIEKVQEEKKEGDNDEEFDYYLEHQRPQSDFMSVLRFIKGRKSKKYELSPSGKWFCFIIRIKVLVRRYAYLLTKINY
jgi:hypothetical protein